MPHRENFSRTDSKRLSYPATPCSFVLPCVNGIFVFHRLWCVACKCLAKPTCQQKEHKTTDFGQDVKEFDGWLVELKTDAHQGIEKVDHGQGYLKQKINQLQAKMEEGEGHRQKLLEIVAHCEEMKQLPPSTKATVFMRKNLRQSFADMKQQVKKAEMFVNRIIPAEDEQVTVKEDEVSCNFHFKYFHSCTAAYIIRQLLKLFALYLQVPSAVAAVVESVAVGSKKKKEPRSQLPA